MTPSSAEAQGLVRADKHPKSTRYSRQNPISGRWNSEEQLVSWRAAHHPGGRDARALERKGIISDRCEVNRQIKADNKLLRELKAEVKKLAALVAHTVPAIAEGFEKLPICCRFSPHPVCVLRYTISVCAVMKYPTSRRSAGQKNPSWQH